MMDHAYPLRQIVNKTPFTNDGRIISRFPPEVNVLPNKRIPQSRRCKVILQRLDENEILEYQPSRMADKDKTPKELKRDTSQGNREKIVLYKGSSTRGNFLDFSEQNSWSPPGFIFSDDSADDQDYVPDDELVWGNKKRKYEEDNEWKPKVESVRSVKRKKVSIKKGSTNIDRKMGKCEKENRFSMEFPKSRMTRNLKCSSQSAENQNTNMKTTKKLQLPYLNKERLQPVSEMKPEVRHLFSNQKKKIKNSFGKKERELLCSETEGRNQIPKYLNDITDEIVLEITNSSSAFTPEVNESSGFGNEEKDNDNIPKYLNEITDEIVSEINNSSSPCSPKRTKGHATFFYGNEETRKMSKFLPERKSLSSEIIDEYVLHGETNLLKESYHHHVDIDAHRDCMYCNDFIELDALTVLAIADLDENPDAFVERSIENAKKMYDKLKSIQPQVDAVNLKLRMVEKSMTSLEGAKGSLSQFGSFINVSNSLMKAKDTSSVNGRKTSESKVVQVELEFVVD